MPFLSVDEPKQWIAGDFDSGTNNITGTVWTNDSLGTAFDLTGYTLELEFWDRVLDNKIKDTLAPAIVTAASGTWKLIVATGDINFDFQGELRLKLTKSGTELTAVGVNGSSDFLVERDI